MLDPLLTDIDVARITGRARSTLQKDRVSGIGIPWVRIGRQVRYRAEDVAVYLAALPSRHSTSEADAQDQRRLGQEDDIARVAKPPNGRRRRAPDDRARAAD